MPRLARSYVRGQFFHVIAQGIKKEYIFNEDEKSEMYIRLLDRYRKEFAIDIIAYCVMGNHVHLLLHSNELKRVSNFMHKVNCVYAMYYNGDKERVGYVFRNRFKMQTIESERYLFSCIDYIHNNPVKAGMCEKKDEYSYSSYREYFSKAKIVSKEWIKRILGDYSYSQLESESDLVSQDITYYDIDINKEDEAKKIVKKFFLEKGKMVGDMMNDKKLLQELVVELKVKNHVTYRCMEKVLNISTKKIFNILCDKKKWRNDE